MSNARGGADRATATAALLAAAAERCGISVSVSAFDFPGEPDSTAAVGSTPEAAAEALRLHGNALFRAGRWEDAERAYTAAHAKAPSAMTLCHRATARLKLGRAADAADDTAAALLLEPHSVRAWLRRAEALAAAGRAADALAVACDGLRTVPRDAPVRQHLQRFTAQMQDAGGAA